MSTKTYLKNNSLDFFCLCTLGIIFWLKKSVFKEYDYRAVVLMDVLFFFSGISLELAVIFF